MLYDVLTLPSLYLAVVCGDVRAATSSQRENLPLVVRFTVVTMVTTVWLPWLQYNLRYAITLGVSIFFVALVRDTVCHINVWLLDNYYIY